MTSRGAAVEKREILFKMNNPTPLNAKDSSKYRFWKLTKASLPFLPKSLS